MRSLPNIEPPKGGTNFLARGKTLVHLSNLIFISKIPQTVQIDAQVLRLEN
ncbi:hypothetical protein AM1_E0161 (plasmid) [Acaryochloris marina MBIC11017]|uniref:Uncharacterized protein n=1 Tax=Acaryochloris marina (strain MBIC 11017) TaxID=329726 RepID=A8ZPJ4_ACAM1|nr:hypothetical protein AM1_E0161 [Acaryochloris marina MBIC11017]